VRIRQREDIEVDTGRGIEHDAGVVGRLVQAHPLDHARVNGSRNQ
jgi:hypothetical protein